MKDIITAIANEIVELTTGSDVSDSYRRLISYVDLGKRRVVIGDPEDVNRPLEARFCYKRHNSSVYRRACVMSIEIANQSSMERIIRLAAKWLMNDSIVTAVGQHLEFELSDLPGCQVSTFSTHEGTFTTISLETKGIDIEHNFNELSVNFHDWSVSAIGSNKRYCILEPESIEQLTTDIKRHLKDGR